MQLHLTQMGKDGEIFKKDAEKLSLRGFCQDKKTRGQQNKEYVGPLSLPPRFYTGKTVKLQGVPSHDRTGLAV